MAPNIQTTLLNQHQPNNASTTNSLILDYLFYQSIQSRLQKAFTFDDQSDGTDKNVIESVIEGTSLYCPVLLVRCLFTP